MVKPKMIPPDQNWAWTESFERRLAELPHRPAATTRLSDPGVLGALLKGLEVRERDIAAGRTLACEDADVELRKWLR
jgi:hypothetical protein